jgi:eukaryotic-like serine/threonine-protein kinase
VINPGDYVGKPYQDVKSALESQGLTVTLNEGNPAESEDQVGLVTAVNPSGNLPKGTSVKVTYFGEMADIPAPAAATLQSANPAPAGSQVSVKWPAYSSCPAGSSLSGYTINISGAEAASNGSFSLGAGQTAYNDIEAGPSGTITVNYAAYCGQRNSAPSPDLNVPVKAAPAPSPTPTPTPSPTIGLGL